MKRRVLPQRPPNKRIQPRRALRAAADTPRCPDRRDGPCLFKPPLGKAVFVRGLSVRCTVLKLVTAFALGLFTAPLAAEAQQAGRVPRIGYVDLRAQDLDKPDIRGLRDGLRELGYVEGQTILIEYRFAAGQADRLAGILDELLRSKVDILLSVGTVVTQAAQRATTTVPIVVTVGDPVSSGFAKNLSRPGRNITGLSLQLTDEFTAKRLELLKEAAPGTRRVGYIWNPRGRRAPGEPLQRAAAALQITLVPIDVRAAQDFDGVFRSIRQQRVDALMTDGDPLTGGAAVRPIADFAATQRLPGIHISMAFVEAGGLMSYGPSIYAAWRRVAAYIDRILRGAKPAELPVEQVSKFDLVINLKTAKALGLKIPQSMLLRADQLIE
jgi:putative ABC transport system substrate-binding protein